MTELLRPAEQLLGTVPRAHRQVRERALARLRDRDPRTIAHAAHALALHRERRGTILEPGLSLGTADHAGEHRVVPVHRPPMLRRERLRLVRDDVGQPSGGQLPVRTLASEVLGQCDGAPQRVADGRRTGQQRERPRCAVGVTGPDDLAARPLELEHEVDRPLDDRPHRLHEAFVAGQQEVMPHAGGHVGAHVGVELVLLDGVGQVVLVPRAVGSLHAHQPLVGPLGRSALVTEIERHGGLDVVPRIGVAARKPRDHPGR